jgi:dTDP-4-dehydrorhamnose 3,5-epimerase
MNKTIIEGAAEIETSPILDSRGSFTRFFCQDELSMLNYGQPIEQINCSLTKKAGTVRGLHFQYPPKSEDKVVMCISGSVYDVMVDIRKNSATYCKWHSAILDSSKMNMVYIPKGLAHGFQTLEDNCRILYFHTEFHAPQLEGGFRFDSLSLNIPWPQDISDISKRDRELKIFEPEIDGIQL